MAVNLPPCPASLKPIAHYLKAAQEHDTRDPVVAYYSRLYAVQSGLKLSSKQPEETNLLIGKPQNRKHYFLLMILFLFFCSHNGMVRNCKEGTF